MASDVFHNGRLCFKLKFYFLCFWRVCPSFDVATMQATFDHASFSVITRFRLWNVKKLRFQWYFLKTINTCLTIHLVGVCHWVYQQSDYLWFYITQFYDLSPLSSRTWTFIATHYSYSNIQVVSERFCVSLNWFIAFYLKSQNAF